jgi:hypothetical protein
VLGICLGWGGEVLAQGTFTLSTVRLGDEAMIRDCEGKPLGGTNYLVQVLVKNPESGRWSPNLEKVTGSGNVRLKPIPLLEGRMVGRFVGGTVRVPFLADGQIAEVLIRVWDVRTGSDYPSATIRGETRAKVQVVGAGDGPPGFPQTLNEFRGPKVCPVAASTSKK